MRSNGTGFGSSFAFLAGVGVGAGLMALLDPGRGAWRRSLIRDKVNHGIHVGRREAMKQVRRFRNEVWGEFAERRAKLMQRNIPDEKLVARVRAQVGHVVRNFSLLNIEAREGHVTIWGPVLRGERNKIIDRLEETRGVHNFYVQVEEHDDLQRLTGMMGQENQRIHAAEQPGGTEQAQPVADQTSIAS